MHTTMNPALSLSILAAAFLTGASAPAFAEQAAPAPATMRFWELVPWLPKSLPAAGEVVAFEEHARFVYLEAKKPGSAADDDGGRIRFLLLRPGTLVVDFWPFDPQHHDLGKPATTARLAATLPGGGTCQRVVCVYQSPDTQAPVLMEARADARGDEGYTIRTGEHRINLTLPAKPGDSGRIAVESRDGKTLLADRRLPDGVLPLGANGMRLLEGWDSRYRENAQAPWDKGVPSPHLKAAVERGEIKPGRAVVLGCGTGTNALYLAGKGFDVTAIDVAPTALNLAEEKAAKANLKVRWLLADVLAPPADLEPFDFIFDRGCYHGVRRGNAKGYVDTARRLSKPGTRVLILAGNANEERHYGPPRVKEEELRGDFSPDFDFVRLDTIRFDSDDPDAKGALAWSALLRRKEPAGSDRTDEQPLALLGSELPNERLDAAKTLGARGEEVIPALVRQLESDNWRVRRAVTDAFSAMGEAGRPAVPALLNAIEDSHLWVRDGAAEALGKIGAYSPEVVAALAKACGDENGWVRYTAGQALTKATRDPEILVPAAIDMLNVRDPFGRARGIGVGILKKHGKGHEGAIPALLNVLNHPSEGMFSATGPAVDALVACGAGQQVLLEPLVRLAESKWWAHRSTAVNLLSNLGDMAGPTIPMIKEIARSDPHPKTRRAARQALDRLTATKPGK